MWEIAGATIRNRPLTRLLTATSPLARASPARPGGKTWTRDTSSSASACRARRGGHKPTNCRGEVHFFLSFFFFKKNMVFFCGCNPPDLLVTLVVIAAVAVCVAVTVVIVAVAAVAAAAVISKKNCRSDFFGKI